MPIKRQPTERQLAALAKAREALAKKHTCERCGSEDLSRGLHRTSQDRIYNYMRDGVVHRYCISCLIYARWIESRQQIEHELQTCFAEQTPFYIFDTETTGKLESRDCQIVEMALVDQDGRLIYHTLCKPDISMPASASAVHGLTNDVLKDAPPFPQVWPELEQILTTNPVPLYAWNADFDRHALLRTAKRYGLTIPEPLALPESMKPSSRWRCAMKLHARWYGEWSTSRNTYRWQSLACASDDLQIQESTAHRATGDARTTLRVLRCIAERVGTSPLPADMPSVARYYEGE